MTKSQKILLPKQLSDEIFEYRPQNFDELRVFKISSAHKKTIELPKMDLLGIMIVISGSAEVEDGTILTKFSTWYLLPNS